MKARNCQIDKHRKYMNFHSIIEITMNIDITEIEAEQMFYALILAQDRSWRLSVPIFRMIS